MKLPRNLSGKDLIKALEKIGYEVTRQKGSHVRLTSKHPAEHHITIPNHDPIKIGTLSAIMGDIALQRKQTKEDLVNHLFA